MFERVIRIFNPVVAQLRKETKMRSLPQSHGYTKLCLLLKKFYHTAGVNIVFESRVVPPGLVFSKFDLFWLSFT